MCLWFQQGDEAAVTMTTEGTLQPWKPDPGQVEGGWPPLGPSLPLPLILAWLGTSTTMAGLNKWIFATHGFCCPLLLSSLHKLSGVAMGYPLGWAQELSPGLPARPRARIYLLSLTCTSVALGNLGLSYVQLDVVQAAATAPPLVTLLLGVLLGAGGSGCHHAPVCAGGLHFHQPGCSSLLAPTLLRTLKCLPTVPALHACLPSPGTAPGASDIPCSPWAVLRYWPGGLLLQEDRLDARSLPSFCLLLAAVALEVGPSWEGALRCDDLWACVLLSCLGIGLALAGMFMYRQPGLTVARA
ncbi:LOW QUALITY PROTEIN: solute carrier family 35 member E4 [Podargus strigoides]